MFHNTLICVFIFFIFSTCSNPSEKTTPSPESEIRASRVIKFNYSGYDDATYSIIYGDVYSSFTDINHADSLQPLIGATIKVEENGKTVSSDSSGHFTIEFEKGVFNFSITKEGYQPLRITNYVSDPDQISFTKIVMEKGNSQQSFKIPEWTK
jgi:hypothetical protein